MVCSAQCRTRSVRAGPLSSPGSAPPAAGADHRRGSFARRSARHEHTTEHDNPRRQAGAAPHATAEFHLIPPARPPTRNTSLLFGTPSTKSCQALVRLSARQPGDERDKPHETEILGQKPIVFATDAHQLLIAVILADRNNQDAARSEPVDQGRRHFRSRGCNEHPLIGRLLGPTLRAIAESADDITQSQLLKAALGVAQQFAVPLDRKYPAAEGWPEPRSDSRNRCRSRERSAARRVRAFRSSAPRHRVG